MEVEVLIFSKAHYRVSLPINWPRDGYSKVAFKPAEYYTTPISKSDTP
jgi:hypothetical protein